MLQADKIKAEIDDFEKYIETNYPSLNTYDGINARIKLIMFTHRNELLGKRCIPDSTQYYVDQQILSEHNCEKILRRTEDCDNCIVIARSESGNNVFNFMWSGWGASDKKMMKALKRGREICPVIFNKPYYVSLERHIDYKMLCRKEYKLANQAKSS